MRIPYALCMTFLAVAVPAACDSIPERVILPNGMHLVVRERHAAPIVAIDFWVRAGSADEQAGENGSAHFLEHTLFKGTTTHGIGVSDYDIENLGGVLNAATGADYAHYYTELPSSHLIEATAVIADIVRHATFPDVEVERERSVILDELAKHDSDQLERIQDRLYVLAFAGKPYQLSPGGQPQSIRLRARDTLVSFFHRLYVPSRCTLALAGDITPDQALSAANKIFGDWTGAETDPIVAQSAISAATGAEEPAGPGDGDAVGFAFPAPAARNSELACVAQVCAALLGGPAEGGRFGAEEWNGTQMAVSYTPRREASLMTITARVPAPIPGRPFEKAPPPAFANVDALAGAIRAELTALAARPPSLPVLAAAVRAVRAHLQYDMETCAGLAHAIGLPDVLGAETPEKTMARLSQITPGEIQQFAAEWLNPTRPIVVFSRQQDVQPTGHQP